MNLPPELLFKVIKISMSNGGDWSEIFVEKAGVSRLMEEDSKIEWSVSGFDSGAGLRLLLGDKTIYVYTNDLSEQGLITAAGSLAGAAGRVDMKGTISLLGGVQHNEMRISKEPSEVPIAKKAELLRIADRIARNVDTRIVQASAVYADKAQDVLIANSLGRFVSDRRVNSVFYVNVIAADKGIIQTGREVIGGFAGFELFSKKDIETASMQAAKRAIRMLEAPPSPSGTMPVVIAGEAGGTMIHEAVGHGLEADLVQKGLSQYGGLLGKQVANNIVTVIDDATLAGKNGSFGFDDEGTPGQRTVIVENGILKSFLHDSSTAKKDNLASTGNARRQSYQFKPIPRMTNTFIAPGASNPKAIISSVKRGLLVRRMGGGQVNTLNGDFVFEVSDGAMIENGKETNTVRGATLTGNGLAVLKNIEAVADDLTFGLGTCGKDGQGVPVGDAQPTILIKELIVGGTA